MPSPWETNTWRDRDPDGQRPWGRRTPLLPPASGPYPLVTVAIIGVCAGIYLLLSVLNPRQWKFVYVNLSVFPARFLGLPDNPAATLATYGVPPEELLRDLQANAVLPPEVGLVTNAFVHVDLLHVFMNMIAFLSFAIVVERRLRSGWFLALFLISAVGGGLAYLLEAALSPTVALPAVGASGAVSGVVAAFWRVRPHAKIFLLFVPVPIPLGPALLVIVAFHVLFIATGWLDGVAWSSHLGGAAAGLIFYEIWRRFGQPPRPSAW